MDSKKRLFDESHENKHINKLNIKNIYEKIVETYKELPNYLKPPKKKTDLFSKLGDKGKESYKKIKKFLSKKL